MSAHAVFYKKFRSKTFFYYVFCVMCMGVVAANIIYSQKYNVYIYGVMEEKSDSVISYLARIWGTSLFNLELERYKNEGRVDIVTQWDKVKNKNTEMIIRLEDATRLYPYAPELYYNLSLLYSENGETTKAKENLLKAQHIDPSLH